MATYYVDSARPDDSGAGTSEATAKKTLAAGFALLSAAGDTLYIKASGTYTLTATTGLTASVKGDVTGGRIRVEGYTTTPGARDGRPTITSATNSVNLITLNDNDYVDFEHLHLTHTASTRGNGFNFATSGSTPNTLRDCVIDGCAIGISGSGFSSILIVEDCDVKNCTGSAGIVVGPQLFVYGSDIHGNTGDGIRTSAGSTSVVNVQDSNIYANGSDGIEDISTNSTITLTLHGCAICGNGGSGVKVAAKGSTSVNFELVNNVLGGNGAYNVENLDTQAEADANLRINRRNFYYASTSGSLSGLSAGREDVTLSGDPFVNAAGGNFALNNTAGAGASVRAAGFPDVFPAGTTTSYRDGGSAQHQDAGGGGTTNYFYSVE